MIKDNRQTRTKPLDFGTIRLNKKYGIDKPINDIDGLIRTITMIIKDSYDEVKDKYDIQRIRELSLSFSQRMDDWAPHAELKMNLSTWETKNEMYYRRSYEKKQLEDKRLKLEQEAKQLGYKLEKVNE